jgi:protein phosphatase 1 regulatory subunit 21
MRDQLLLQTFADLSRAYSQKSNLEHELPTSSDRLRTTDECLVKSLGAMVSATGKVRIIIIYEVC